MHSFRIALSLVLFLIASAVAAQTIEVRIQLKDFNIGRLHDELKMVGLAGGGPITGMGTPGFDPVNPRRITPAPARRVVGKSVENGVTTEDFADPGELRFRLSRVLTVGESTTLDTTLSTHDFTKLSQEQIRQNQDAADLEQLRTAYINWDSLTNIQRNNALKLLVRLFIRDQKGDQI